ncbi:GATA transcription factor 19-like isoform X2 [Argentina anserina]|uniref:GATA transcription factor 19-like isoform X1 n=1 Tax=Argentina anserina TaxID=57926 RepID=UPI0021763ED1|nr:GATA transcription factor 19-like isoform X1 [Potentilla anserina]XP_050379193.1 GATA transcription factor 19-like isoform X2 [Potentilla anserina]
MAAVNPQPLQVRPYEAEAASFQVEDDEGEYEYGGGDEAMEGGEEEEAHAISAAAARGGAGGVSVLTSAAAVGTRTSELTLSFEGEVFVFPAVTAQKVQAVLLLLGGRDVPSGVPTVGVTYDQNTRGVSDTPKRSNLSRRIASLVRFREKRKERCFDKKIRYTVRKEVAQRMHRKNGQFASLKENSGGSGCDSAQSSLQDGTPLPLTVLRRCQHCGVGENSTPAMRRGPAGPRTLCNACGLMWANKGTLRDLSKGGRNHSMDHIEPGTLLEMKPSVVECEFPGNQHGHGAPVNPSKLVIDGSNDASVNLDVENFHESGGDLANTLPMEIVCSTNDDEQEPLLELPNTSDTDFDIPTNFN